jgi:hypothetical protein
METPPYYSSVNPLWQEGRDWGINEERERIIAKLKEFARIMADDDQPSYVYYVHAITLIQNP